jgi:hypothetical protein
MRHYPSLSGLSKTDLWVMVGSIIAMIIIAIAQYYGS